MSKSKLALCVLAVVVLVGGLVVFLVDADQVRPRLESELSQALSRKVTLGKLSLSLLRGSAEASQLTIADDPKFSQAPFLQAKSLAIDVDVFPLVFSKQLHVNGLVIEDPAINLLSSDSGSWNYSSLGSGGGGSNPAPSDPGQGLALSIKSIRITGGRISVGKLTAGAKPVVLEKVTLAVRDFSPTAAVAFEFEGRLSPSGTLKAEGKAGPFASGNAALTPISGVLSLKDVDLTALGPSAAGLLSGDTTLASAAQAAEVQGKLRIEKLQLAANGAPSAVPVELTYKARHNPATRAGALESGVIRVGKASATLAGRYDLKGTSPAITLAVNGNQMAVDELSRLLPAFGVKLPAGSSLQGGTFTVNLSTTGTTAAPVTTGAVHLANTKLAGFDAGAKMATIGALAGFRTGGDTVIQELSASLNSSPAGTQLNDIRLLVPSLGDVTGQGSVSPSQALDFHLVAKLAASGARSIPGSGTVPFLVSGTASDPVFKPDTGRIVESAVTSAVEKYVPKDSPAGGLLKGILGGGKKK
jgi:AsmA protein